MPQLRHSTVTIVWLLFGCGVLWAAPAGSLLPLADLAQNKNLTNTVEYQRWWWASSQRASRRGLIPEQARLHALDQIREAGNRQEKATALSPGQSAVEIQGNQWVSLGPAPLLNAQGIPTGGRVANVAVNPHNSSHWLIGAAQGGVWETRDAGATWSPRTDDQASLAMGAIAFAPSSTNIIYAGTGEGVGSADAYAGLGLLKSTNAGGSWQLLATDVFAQSSLRVIRVKATDPNILLAATVRGLAGVSGGLLPSPPPVGIYKSSDGGVSWSLKLDARIRLMGGGWDIESFPGDFNRHYAAAGSVFGNPTINGVYRTIDAGESWQLVVGPWTSLTDRVERVELALAPSAPNTLYVSIQDAFGNSAGIGGALLGVWKTTNAWATSPNWTQLPNPPTSSTRFWYNHEIIVDPVNSNVVYLGEVEFWKYNGTSWTDVRANIHEDQQSMAWAGNRLIVGNDGGLWSSVDGGNSWSNHNANLSIIQFYQGSIHPTNPNFALGGTQDNATEIWKGPRLWNGILFGDGGYSAISASRPDTDWAVSAQTLDIYRTLDGGMSFSPATAGMDRFNALFIAPFRKCPCNDNVFIAGTDNLWKSTNFFTASGPSWFSNGPELGDFHTAMAFAPSDSNCLTYAFGTLSGGQVNVTTDGGSTWSDLINFGRYVSGLAFHPTNANILYVTLSSFNNPDFPPVGHVFKTTNALAAAPVFRNVSPPVDIPFNAIVLDPSNPNTLYVGTDIGIWKSQNGGTNWIHVGPESGMPNVAVFDLEVSQGAGRLIAFTHGRGAFALLSPPKLIAGRRIGTAFAFSFATLPGGQYMVQYKNSLNDPTWQALTTVNGDGTVKSLTNNTASSQRFYRATVR
jgi:photosystem II stability/assembly factor-like uncharacterized protein